ncbi:RHS repeat-associated core domain-containing protein [Luteibacter aegosomatissinici]|uniref:RHS repeat-associated core domain-containing protein n=1 Tax=Luteibacter aegosomatissinici TaxID=2911539 RepID=UPI001FF9B926|nr:RHS repeat-associated core domain-containing protein [Luteibacter aegosomatissinici]UPG95258.1 RHS repeat-associated core domain-containing protein [Luteibacter aegosomatissinici]
MNRTTATKAIAILLVLLFSFNSAAASDAVTYYYTDQQGTVLSTADSSGNILSTSDYRPYGPLARGTPEDGPGYTGHVNDADTDLVYMQARYYDPSTGRFLSVDPAIEVTGDILHFGRFTYTSNNPIRMVDPDGAQEVDAEELDIETREQMARVNPPLGPNMALPGYVAPITPAPGFIPETFTDHVVAQNLGLEPTPVVGENLPSSRSELTKTYEVYTKTNPETGEVYTGRTSGTNGPEQNVARRDSSHHMTANGFGPAVLQYTSTNSDAIRGQEQILIESNGGARRGGGSSGNEINGVSPQNNKIQVYINAARSEFGGG